MPRKEFVFSIILLMALTGIGLFYYASQISKDSQKEYAVELRENSFHPKEVTIQKGDAVKFTSQTRNFWPASDSHPSHGIYSEFDSGKPIAPDGGWVFRFEKSGEWEYHDHLAPYFTGKIIVKGENKNNEKDVSKKECRSSNSSEYCWQEDILSVLEEGGISAAFDRLAALYNNDPNFRFSCHYVSHNVGIASYAYFLKDRDSILTPKASYCANGFYHGFMEAFLGANLDPQEAREFCGYIDEKMTSQAPDASLQCFHGIGHGAMDMAIISEGVKGGELEMIGPALQICENASETPEQLYRCASGIFNGIANFYIKDDYDLSINKEDPLWVCHEQQDKYKEPCYGNMIPLLFWLEDNDFSQAAYYIESIGEETQEISAIKYLAGLGALYEGSEYAVEDCRFLKKHLRLPCIEGFVQGFLEHGEPGLEYQEAFSFCRSLSMTYQEKEACFRYALNLGGWYSKEKVKEICAGVDAEYRKFCK